MSYWPIPAYCLPLEITMPESEGDAAGAISRGRPGQHRGLPLKLRLLGAVVFGGGLGPTANVKLLEDVLQMDANGPGTDFGLLRDLLIGEPLGEQDKNPRLAGCQPVSVGHSRRRGRRHPERPRMVVRSFWVPP